jgi:hypothetical protein
MPDEEAFSLLVRLMQMYDLRGHYMPEMPKLQMRLVCFLFNVVYHSADPFPVPGKIFTIMVLFRSILFMSNSLIALLRSHFLFFIFISFARGSNPACFARSGS